MMIGAALGALAPGVARCAEIRIWPTAVVTGGDVVLTDVARLSEFDADREALLRAYVIYPAPRQGGRLLLSAGDVRAALAESGVNLADVRIVGASRCEVSKPAPPVEKAARREAPRRERVAPRVEKSGDETESKSISQRPAKQIKETPAESNPSASANTGTLEAQLKDFISARAGFSEGRVEARFSAAGAEALALSAPHTFRIRPRTDRTLGLLSFDVDVLEDGAVIRRVPIVAEANLVREVLVARRAINRGEVIEARAVRLEERRFADAAAVGITDPVDAIGRSSKSFLRPGEMVTASGIEEKPIVTRGQAVTIWMRQGKLSIRATGKAQQSGALGDRIEVLRDGTRKKSDMLEAVVTGPATVTVAPTQWASAGSVP